MDEFVKKNLEKAEEKAKKKREKKGVSASTLYQAANTNTKKAAPPANSLAAKAGMVQQYNEEHGEVPETSGKTQRKKYKK